MADETISTRIVANADFSALIADVHKVTASLSRLQEQLANSNKMMANQIAVMNRSFSDTLRSTGQFSSHFVSLTSDVEKFGKNLDGGRLKLKDYFNTFQGHVKTSGGLIRDLARQQVAMQNAILQPLGRNAQGLMQFNVHVPRGLDEIKNKTAMAKQELQIMNRVIQDGAGQLINWGKNTQWAGRQLTVGLTLPLAAFGKAAADAFRLADQELVRLTKVYGDVAGTSAAELDKVRDSVIQVSKELSAAYGTNFRETIALAADIAATGKQGQELLDSVKETSRLAVLGEVDRQEAMRATLAIQSAFKQNTDELAQSINFLNAVENQTSTTLNDLVEAIPKAGPVVRGLGGSVQDLALYLTAMREGGINATEGANALKSALASLINPTDVAVAKFEGFGIDLMGIVNNNAGNVTATLLELQSALDRLNPLQKQQAIEQLFGKFQFSRLNALFENLGRQGSQTLQVLDLMKASASDLEAVAGRELTAVTESASGKYKRAIESLKADLAGLGDSFLTISTNIINIVDKALDFFNGLPKPIKQALTFLGGLTAIAGPLIMLTGVLANFFGYILKGTMHLKAFFKGGEGWKYLTPEMLAAEKAGKLVEQSFYSDAKAAAILQTALRNLIDEFSVLETKAKSGAMAVNPAVTTMAGNLVMGAGGRVVNPQHPLAGAMGTRASTHMVPRAGLTEEQRMQQTIFGLVPGSIPVNRKIGDAPQIYMNEPLPNVPGLTSIGGVSTGVVSGEAARWHAMMATLAMQSKAEIEMLKKQIAATGVVSKDFMMQFDDILPVVSKLTDNAAKQSSLIVAELRVGKLTVEQARQQIIALNLETERMITQAVGAQAAAMGRTINPTMVPTLNQPVVDPTGKSNMRELFKKSKTRDLIDKISRSLGVRTSGAGYNIETTRPKKFAMGGVDIQKYSKGYTSIKAAKAASSMLRAFAGRSRMIGGLRTPRRSTIGGSEAGAGVTFGQIYKRDSKIYSDPDIQAYGITPTSGDDFLVHGMVPGFLSRTRNMPSQGSAPFASSKDWSYFNLQTTSKQSGLQLLPSQFIKNDKLFNNGLRSALGADPSTFRPVTGSDMVSLLLFLKDQGVKPNVAKLIADRAANVLNQKVMSHKGPITEAAFGKLLNNASVRAISSGFRPSMVRDTNHFGSDAHSRNRGLKAAKYADGVTQLPGYGGGDIVPALLEPGESVVTKTGTRGNKGALTLINAGYSLDNIMGFEEGAVDVNGKSRGMGSGMGMFLGGMGVQMAGGAIGGGIGTAMSTVGMAMQFMPMIPMMGKLKGAVSSTSAIFKTLGTIATAALNGIKIGLTALTRALPALAAITTAIMAFKFIKKQMEDNRREAELLGGTSKKTAEEAKVKYVDLAESIKLSNEQLKLARERGLAAYAAYTSSGVPGLTLTIKQLRELKKEVKETMPETMKVFNSISNTKVVDFAKNLKAQYIAGGMSVQDATNKIYAMIEASNKAGMGLKAISDVGFTAIKDKVTAAEAQLSAFNKTMDNITGTDSKAFASGIDTVIGSLESAVQSLVGTKDASGQTITEAQAIAIQYEKIAKSGLKNKQIGEQGLKNLQKHKPELAAIINSSDTIASIYAKWKIALAGVAVDIKNLTAAQAESIALYQEALGQSADAAEANTKSGAALENSAKATAKLKKEISDANRVSKNASKGEAGYNKERIRAIQDEIKAIRKRADEKKKALQDSLNAENTGLELQKLQLDYQAALARGDKDAAAQAQIQIQQLTKQYQTQKAIDKIEENARKEEDKLQAKLDADARKKEDQARTGAAAGETAEKKTATLNKINEISNKLTDLAVRQANINLMPEGKEKDTMAKAVQGDFKTLLDDLTKSSDSVQQAFKQFVNPETNKIVQGTRIPKRGFVGGADSAFNRVVGEVSEGAAINYDKMREAIGGGMTLKDVVDAIKGNQVGGAKGKTGKGGIGVSTSTTTVRGQSTTTSTVNAMDLYNAGISTAMDTVFVDKNGTKWKITGTASAATGYGLPVKKARYGGVASSNQPLIVGDGGKPELFVPQTNGIILPDLNRIQDLGPKFNIPTGTISGGIGAPSTPSNNSTYNINIELNGTNVTADDIMRKFKSELALINAKEGRTRTVGGTY